MRESVLNKNAVRPGAYVLYWMQQSQRTRCNHALEYAIELGNRLKKPVLVCFGLCDAHPNASRRHYLFLLQGLCCVSHNLRRRHIGLVVETESPLQVALRYAHDAVAVVTDRGYLPDQRRRRRQLAAQLACPVWEVESNVVVPVETALNREAYSAATLRTHLSRHAPHFLVEPRCNEALRDSTQMGNTNVLENIETTLELLHIDNRVPAVSWLRGGEDEAAVHLDEFVASKLDRYGDLRNDPGRDYGSHMSPYLHFGQISPLEIALAVNKARSPGSDRYLEELLVRRELSMNMLWFNPRAITYAVLPSWAQATLHKHQSDHREYCYTAHQLEHAQTHDPYWNAAQYEMTTRGTMHGYLRMYWGKKILEWTPTPRRAYTLMVRLNNRYFLDGSDPNGYAGTAWCLGKHDRPWKERPIFGTVRYMNAAGLERKFDMNAYLERVGRYQVS